MHLRHGHLQWRMRHLERPKIEPVRGPRQASVLQQAVIERCGRERRDLAEYRQSRRPLADLFDSSRRHARRVVIETEDKGSYRVHIPFRQPSQHSGVFGRSVEAFVNVLQVLRVKRFHADKYPLAARFGDQVDEFLVAEEVGADLAYPVNLCVRRDNGSQQRLCPLYVDGEIVIDEEDGNFPIVFSGPRLQSEHLVDHALVSAEAYGISKETGDRAKLTAVGTAASGFNGNQVKALAMKVAQHHPQKARHLVELVEIHRFPWNLGISV